MTDKEIKKALECCGKNHITGSTDACEHCFLQNSAMCVTELIYKSLDLINRQQAEIERLKEDDKAYPCKVVVGNNCLVYSKSLDDYDRLIDDISAEAIKEFAERLKYEIDYCDEQGEIFINSRSINEVLKEMVGEQE